MDQKSVPKISFYLVRSTRQRFTNGNTLSTLSAWGAIGLSATSPRPLKIGLRAIRFNPCPLLHLEHLHGQDSRHMIAPS